MQGLHLSELIYRTFEYIAGMTGYENLNAWFLGIAYLIMHSATSDSPSCIFQLFPSSNFIITFSSLPCHVKKHIHETI
jgi:hypothetical protein